MSNSRPLVYIAYISGHLHVAQILEWNAQHTQQKRWASWHNWLPAITDCSHNWSHESHNWSHKQPIAPLVVDDDDDGEDDDGYDDGDGDESSLSNTQTLTQ